MPHLGTYLPLAHFELPIYYKQHLRLGKHPYLHGWLLLFRGSILGEVSIEAFICEFERDLTGNFDILSDAKRPLDALFLEAQFEQGCMSFFPC